MSAVSATNRFSIRRMWHVLTLDVVRKRNAILLRGGLLLLAMSMAGFFSVSFMGDSPKHPEAYLDSFVIVMVFFIFLFSALGASFFCDDLRDKESRISSFMLPALSVEKYVARFVIWVAGVLGLCAIGFVAAVVMHRWGVVYWTDGQASSPMVGDYIRRIGWEEFCGHGFGASFAKVAMCLFVMQSFFVLGSSIWPKASFIKTALALFLVAAAYQWIGVAVWKAMSAEVFLSYDEKTVDEMWGMFWVEGALMLVFNYVLCYFRIRETDIINHWR